MDKVSFAVPMQSYDCVREYITGALVVFRSLLQVRGIASACAVKCNFIRNEFICPMWNTWGYIQNTGWRLWLVEDPTDQPV